MQRPTRVGFVISVTALLVAETSRRARRRSERAVLPAVSSTDAVGILTRTAPLLRLPTSPDRPPEVMPDGSGLRCATTGRIYPYRDGVLDLLLDQVGLSDTQQALNTPVTAWAYDRCRDLVMRLFGLKDFATEVASAQNELRLGAGDTILDLACGHGNFTVEWAKRVGPDGLVIGLDISPAMLARAAARVARWQLRNVLLIRGDAQRLPLAESSIQKVNCSGGFHQLPDLPQALREITRVSMPGAVLAASTFAQGPDDAHQAIKAWLKRRFELHFVPLVWLEQQLAELGYEERHWSLPGGWFGYVTARKAPV